MEQKMNLNPGDLYRWYTSLRTQYVKEVKKRENVTRSGAGVTDELITPRTTWLLEKFEFVKPYVCQTRATRGSKIQKCDLLSDSSPQQTGHESTPKSSSSSTTTALISSYLDKVSNQLSVPKSDIEKTCDFLGVLMNKMTPTCLEEFTHEVTCKAMEYVKQSNVERRQTPQSQNTASFQTTPIPITLPQQLQQTNQPSVQFAKQQTQGQAINVHGQHRSAYSTDLSHGKQVQVASDYIMARNIAASNPPSEVLQQQGRYQWTQIQPVNLQPVLPEPQHVVSGSQSLNTTSSTDTASIYLTCHETLSPDPANPAFN